MFIRYLKYFLAAGDEHSIHSPFIFELYCNVIKQRKRFYLYEELEKLRKGIHSSQRIIEVKDFGAGSKIFRSNKRKISDIAKHTEKPAEIGELLFRLIEHFKPATILDLGTSLGLTTAYMASAHKASTVLTFEGCPQTASVAKENFKKLGLQNIQLTEGNLDETLSDATSKLDKIDFAFFDANHRYEPTLRYFKTCLKKAQEESVFIFDDIHWSEEMEKAWEEIKADKEVTLSIDLFHVGIIFFRKKQPKQHFILKF